MAGDDQRHSSWSFKDFRVKADSPVLIWDAFSPVLPCVVTACKCSNMLLSTPDQLWLSVFPSNLTYMSSRVSKDLNNLLNVLRYCIQKSDITIWAQTFLIIWSELLLTFILYFYILTWCQLVTHLCLFYVSTGIFRGQNWYVSQVTLISIPLYTINTVSKQLHNDKQAINCVNVVKLINYETNSICALKLLYRRSMFSVDSIQFNKSVVVKIIS